MGSIDNAFRTGFVCRLCSKVDRNVIHIYGEKGRRMKLLHIIKTSLSINVRTDTAIKILGLIRTNEMMISVYFFVLGQSQRQTSKNGLSKLRRKYHPSIRIH